MTDWERKVKSTGIETEKNNEKKTSLTARVCKKVLLVRLYHTMLDPTVLSFVRNLKRYAHICLRRSCRIAANIQREM